MKTHGDSLDVTAASTEQSDGGSGITNRDRRIMKIDRLPRYIHPDGPAAR